MFAVVTGAASGIGREVALQLAERGYAVATELLPASAFYPAEAYHQDFAARTGRGGCHFRVPRFGE